MHEMLTISDVRGVCLSLSVMGLKSALAHAVLCARHRLVQPLPNAFGLLFGLVLHLLTGCSRI